MIVSSVDIWLQRYTTGPLYPLRFSHPSAVTFTPNFSAFWTVLKQHFAQSSVVSERKNSRTAQYGNTKNTLHEKLKVVKLPGLRGTGASVSGLET
jgi:hypothetical protein